jgi:uncharacterized membrane protein YbhN (UPF0104 family)
VLKDKKFWLGLVFSLGLLWLSLRGIHDWGQLRVALSQANYVYLVPALALYLVGYWSRARRVSQILKPIKEVPTHRALPPLVIGFMFNNILPGRLGEFVFAFLLGRRESISRTASLAAVVISRILDGFVILCFFVFGMLAFLPLAGGAGVGGGEVQVMGQTFLKQDLVGKVYLAGILGLLVFGSVFVGCFCLIVWKDATLRLLDRLLKFFPARFSSAGREALEKFIAGLHILKDARSLLAVFLFNFVPWGLEALTYLFTGWTLGLSLNFRQVCLVMGATNLFMIVPSAPGGIGPFEFAGLGTMALFGMTSSVSVLYILMVHAIIWAPINLWAFYFLVKEGISFRDALKAGAE